MPQKNHINDLLNLRAIYIKYRMQIMQRGSKYSLTTNSYVVCATNDFVGVGRQQ